MEISQEHLTSEVQFPNDTSEYRPTSDFFKAKRYRNIHGWIIREVIENGRRVPDPQDGMIQFRRILQGSSGCFEWKFVVAYNPNGPNELVTGYVPEFPNDKTTQTKKYQKEFPR